MIIDQMMDWVFSGWGLLVLILSIPVILTVVNYVMGPAPQSAVAGGANTPRTIPWGEILKWTTFVLLGIAAAVLTALIVSEWDKPDSSLLRAGKILLGILFAGFLLVILWHLVSHPGNQNTLKNWFQASGPWIFFGVLLFLFPILLFNQAGWDLVSSLGYVAFVIFLMIIAIESKKNGGRVLPVSLLGFFLLVWAAGATPQGFWRGFQDFIGSVSGAIAYDFRTKVGQAEWAWGAIQPGAVHNAPPRDQHLVITNPKVETYRPFDNGFNFKNLCGDKPCIDPPNAPYWNGKVTGGEAPASPPTKAHSTNLALKEVLIVEPTSAYTKSTRPLPPGHCVRAGVGTPHIWNSATNEIRVELDRHWDKISMVGDTYPLLSANGKKATVEVTPSPCPTS